MPRDADAPGPASAPSVEDRAAGLCATCRWTRRVRSGRGAVFFLCQRSETDPAYPRYPRLPRLQCDGYERIPVTG